MKITLVGIPSIVFSIVSKSTSGFPSSYTARRSSSSFIAQHCHSYWSSPKSSKIRVSPTTLQHPCSLQHSTKLNVWGRPSSLGTSLKSSSSSSSSSMESTKNPSTTKTTIMTNNPSTTKMHTCQFCNAEFASRNALFRHLRTSTECYNRAKEAAEAAATATSSSTTPRRDGILQLDKRKVAIQFGYHAVGPNKDDATTTTTTTTTNLHNSNEMAATLVRTAFFEALVSLYPSSPVEDANGKTHFTSSSFTQASAAKLRHPSLSQDEDCSASTDVIGITYRGGPPHFTASSDDIPNLITRMQEHIVTATTATQPTQNDDTHHPHDNYMDGKNVQVLGVECLPVSTKFHAEQSCSQRAYHYMIPISWLDDSPETHKWVRQKVKQQQEAAAALNNNNNNNNNTTSQNNEGGHHARTYNTPTSILKLKEALKCAESRDVQQQQQQKQEASKDDALNDETDKDKESSLPVSSPSATTTGSSTTLVPSRGRFGSLWLKERRPWHNFCDPSLGGMASPSNEPVWRSVDRARLFGFLLDKDEQPLVVLEFRGDGFVKGQIRRVVASAIVMSKGWLPSNFFDIATRSDICVETPVAPQGRLYFSSARFHFVELVTGSTLFDTTTTNTNLSKEWLDTLQSHLLDDRSTANAREEENSWIEELEHVTSPRIQMQLDKVAADDAFREKQIRNRQEQEENSREMLFAMQDSDFSATPKVYEKTLSLLRDVCREKKWPVTSGARSRIIRSPTLSRAEEPSSGSSQEPVPSTKTVRATSSQFQGQVTQCGSFTVVNPQLFDGNSPLGNELFPDLVEAVFELERELAANSLPAAEGMEKIVGRHKRELSTHCAVNRNAEFTPHVDSGKGQGQSFSMIVGLGDYIGGGLAVEGKSYGVRYEPLEFDGWKQIHSTEPFEGERYSLVWFTPEKREESSVSAGESKEDARARVLVDAHTLRLPSFPVLEFRKHSTDALVINEILDTETGCAYELFPKSWGGALSSKKLKTDEPQTSFSPRGHKTVLDIGAHIGVFSRYALSVGCEKVIAYEPEPENLKLLKRNLEQRNIDNLENNCQVVEIHDCAVAHGDAATKKLVHARTRNDGTLNTWRHSLEDYSQYVDKAGMKLPSKAQETVLTRSQVSTVPFFGFGGALQPRITFVKLDCEGAEIDILLSPESSEKEMWLDATNVVFEWSFTKERRVERFHQAVRNLEAAGFKVVYEGQGSWWDTEINCMWPYHNDLVVFAMR